MKFVKRILIGSGILAALCAYAEYEVTYTFVNGAQRTTDELVIQRGRVILAKENLQIPFEQVKSAVFVFEQPLSLDECEAYLKSGSYDEMVTRIDAFLAPVEQGLALPGNLDEYLQYKLRACFWTQNYSEALAIAQMLMAKGSDYASLARLYEVLILLEQGTPVEEVRVAFSKMNNPQDISGAMAGYIRGRLSLEEREREVALQHFSHVLVNYRHDPEWVPAATFFEGVVYKKTGFLEQAGYVAEELKIAYPDSYWSGRADELE